MRNPVRPVLLDYAPSNCIRMRSRAARIGITHEFVPAPFPVLDPGETKARTILVGFCGHHGEHDRRRRVLVELERRLGFKIFTNYGYATLRYVGLFHSPGIFMRGTRS